MECVYTVHVMTMNLRQEIIQLSIAKGYSIQILSVIQFELNWHQNWAIAINDVEIFSSK